MKKLLQRVILGVVFCAITTAFGVIAYYVCQAQQPEAQLQTVLLNSDKRVTKAFFSPDDNPRDILLDLIRAEKKRILIAIYTFTEKDIALACIDAHQRGVIIEIVADRGYGSDRFSRIPQLANHKIPIWIYQICETDKQESLMHDKFCIFEDNFMHKSLVWTGSYNFTRRASTANQENIIILDAPEIVESFTKHFQILKDRSLLISGQPQKSYKKEHKAELLWWEQIAFMLGWSR
jgi:phosphatidylserine/phosphatidylglycerophosphate/cardiolipin synthase-like enzyme